MTTPPPKGLNHPPDPALRWMGLVNGQAAWASQSDHVTPARHNVLGLILI